MEDSKVDKEAVPVSAATDAHHQQPKPQPLTASRENRKKLQFGYSQLKIFSFPFLKRLCRKNCCGRQPS
jgi:hypothetical protein